MLASASDAVLKSAHAELASEHANAESAKAALRTELAVLCQKAEADKAALTQQVQELTLQHEAQNLMQGDNSAELAERGQQPHLSWST